MILFPMVMHSAILGMVVGSFIVVAYCGQMFCIMTTKLYNLQFGNNSNYNNNNKNNYYYYKLNSKKIYYFC